MSDKKTRNIDVFSFPDGKNDLQFNKRNKMYEFRDVYIEPQFSEIESRSQVNVSSILDPFLTKTEIKVPVISANMDSVTDGHMANAMANAGAIGAIHRFMSIKNNVIEYKKVKNGITLVSVGVSDDSLNRVDALYEAGARHFIIDIAHGHHILMKNTIIKIRNKYNNIFIMAGNVATYDGALALSSWGADAVKCGIGPGFVCTTKNVTGVTVPQFHAISECVRASENTKTPMVVVADGGVREIGDIAKALGAGADFVMAGSMFSACSEAPLPGIYRGSASTDVMKKVKNNFMLPTAEGKSIEISSGISVDELILNIRGGLQSSFSYSNSKTLSEFHIKCKFGFRI